MLSTNNVDQLHAAYVDSVDYDGEFSLFEYKGTRFLGVADSEMCDALEEVVKANKLSAHITDECVIVESATINTPQFIISFAGQCLNSNWITRLLRFLVSEFNITSIDLPSKGYLTDLQYGAYLKTMLAVKQPVANEDATSSRGTVTVTSSRPLDWIPMYVVDTGEIVKLTDAVTVFNHSIGKMELILNWQALVPMGTGAMSINGRTKVGQEWMGADDFPLVVPTPDQVTARAARVTSEFINQWQLNEFEYLTANGVGLVPGFFRPYRRPLNNNRIMFDTNGLRMLSPDVLSDLVGIHGLHIPSLENSDSIVDYGHIAPEFLLTRICIVYSFYHGEWMVVDSEAFNHIQFKPETFDKLVLDDNRKRILRAVVEFKQDTNVDLIDGKGGGTVILLDGAPGTGKTLTAEACSEVTRRPLYKVNIGDLGTNVEMMERELQITLEQATRWNALLLLDEADVYMEKRTSDNLDRNAMVSVFLRHLEYYSGTIFLTTNRGDDFDEAFQSRITVALRYEATEIEGRLKIWNGLLELAGIVLTEQERVVLSEYEVNGREIKNTINTARAIAASEQTCVKSEHLIEVLCLREVFNEHSRAHNVN